MTQPHGSQKTQVVGQKSSAQNISRVTRAGLVGEIVLTSTAGAPSQQFALTPYAAGFTRGDAEFTLATVHVLWGSWMADRPSEITALGLPRHQVTLMIPFQCPSALHMAG